MTVKANMGRKPSKRHPARKLRIFAAVTFFELLEIASLKYLK
jgi:hypothetical protein